MVIKGIKYYGKTRIPSPSHSFPNPTQKIETPIHEKEPNMATMRDEHSMENTHVIKAHSKGHHKRSIRCIQTFDITSILATRFLDTQKVLILRVSILLTKHPRINIFDHYIKLLLIGFSSPTNIT